MENVCPLWKETRELVSEDMEMAKEFKEFLPQASLARVPATAQIIESTVKDWKKLYTVRGQV